MMTGEAVEVFESSGNVFADLGLPRARELYVDALAEIIASRCSPGCGSGPSDELRADIEACADDLAAEEVVAFGGPRRVAEQLATRYLEPHLNGG